MISFCAPHQLFPLSWLSSGLTKKQAKDKWPGPWQVYFAWRKRQHAEPMLQSQRNQRRPHWEWDTHKYKVASTLQRYKAKYRRQFKTWCHIKEKEFGEYWDWEYDGDKWDAFAKEQACP